MGSRTIVLRDRAHLRLPPAGHPARHLLGGDLLSENFAGGVLAATAQLVVTNAASHPLVTLPAGGYLAAKARWTAAAVRASEEIIGQYQPRCISGQLHAGIHRAVHRGVGGAVYGAAR